MQLNKHTGGAAALAAHGPNRQPRCMQYNAPDACIDRKSVNIEKTIKKTGTYSADLVQKLSGKLAMQCANDVIKTRICDNQ
ncbi:hypothetical protein P2G74_10055 [Cronobacter muytjensii]|uniref:hypothetical protein n=1 Tax=Cronobacter muytjensii TaxID=413501 RepID=UPI002A141DE6|nr:hypothetical protein [Cronobacter muytjensii]ELY6275310.1 hypothetical protein [Cronobacter muytjensii]MEB8640304.1 hypothetical protein [Cronobacter muytjensii]